MKPNFKYAVIHRHCERYPIKEMCCFFEVSRSGYYKYLKHIEHPAKDFKLAEKIRAKQETCRRTYGYRRMKLWLDSEGIAKNPKTVLRIMHKYGFLSEVRRRKKWQKMGDDKHRYDNLLNHFGKQAPAIGFVVQVDDLLEAISRQKIEVKLPKKPEILFYTDETFKEVLNKARKLRNEGISVSLEKRV